MSVARFASQSVHKHLNGISAGNPFAGALGPFLAWPENTVDGRGILRVKLDAPSIHHCAVVVVVILGGEHNKLLFRAI